MHSTPPPACLHQVSSPLGLVWLAARDQGLCGLWFSEQKHLPDFSDTRLWHPGEHRYTQAAAHWLQRYFSDEPMPTPADIALDLSAGTAFQQSVWRALIDIPLGSTISYGVLAHNVGKPAAVRAVGTAVGRNPISLIVPCHRVIGKNGSLTGYAGGLDRKNALLQLEQTKF